jgi:hypothetical protein
MINYDDFQHVNFIFFHKISFDYFKGLFSDETDLRVRCMNYYFMQLVFIKRSSDVLVV